MPNSTPSEWASVNAWRKEARTRLRVARSALSPAERRTLHERVRVCVATTFPELKGVAAGFYWPIHGEVDLLPLMKQHVKDGGTAALPVVVERNAPVRWCAWTPQTAMEPGIWKIPVPVACVPVEPVALLVPLLGFDGAGYRLGNGGGYYDRSLAEMAPAPLTVGIGLDLGRLDSIHPQAHDIPLDVIVTESGVHWPPLTGAETAAHPGNSSPVCYAEDADPAYFGYLSRAETLALLRNLLTEEQEAPTGVSVARERGRLRRCVLLRRLIEYTGTSHATDADAPSRLPPTDPELRELLPRIADPAVRRGLDTYLALRTETGPGLPSHGSGG